MQRVLAGLIAREVKDPRVGNVTITGREVAADMGYGADLLHALRLRADPHEQVQKDCTRAAGFLRGELGRRLGLRHAPRCIRVRRHAEDAARLTRLIDQAVAEDRTHEAGPESAPDADTPPGAEEP